MKQITLSEVASLLSQHDDFKILTHSYPDGDCLGCGYALTAPFPGVVNILEELRERGVKFILSSDSHAADTLDCAFDRFAAAEAYVEAPFG